MFAPGHESEYVRAWRAERQRARRHLTGAALLLGLALAALAKWSDVFFSGG